MHKVGLSFLLASTTACTLAGHQIGIQTPGLPLTPGGPVEVSGALALQQTLHGDVWPSDVPGPTFLDLWEVHGAASVRFALSERISMRFNVGTGSDATTVSTSVFHHFSTAASSSRLHGGLLWGLGHRVQGLSWANLDPDPLELAATHGVHVGGYFTASFRDHVGWQVNTLFHAPLLFAQLQQPTPRSDRTLAVSPGFLGEYRLATGPVFWAHGPAGSASTWIMADVGVAVDAGFVPGLYPRFTAGISVGRGPRPGW